MRRIACLWIPDWPLQRLWARRPDLRDGPVLFQSGDARRESRVVLCSPAARERGVREGMAIVEARELLERPSGSRAVSSNGQMESFDRAQEWQAWLRLAFWCEQFSPLVGWMEGEPGNGSAGAKASRIAVSQRCKLDPHAYSLFLDLTHVVRLLGGEQSIVRRVANGLNAWEGGYSARMAIADSVGAAWGIAHYAPLHDAVPYSGGFLSWIVPPGDRQFGGACEDRLMPEVISQLPVAALRLSREVIQRLEQLGVVTVGQLVRLPRSSLAARLGECVPLRLAQLTGEAAEFLQPARREPEFRVEWCLEHPREDREVLQQILLQLVQQLVEMLRQHGRGALRLVCQLDQRQLPVGLYEPSADAPHLWDLLRAPWERLQLERGVSRLELHAPLTVPLTARQTDLLQPTPDSNARTNDREWAVLLDRLTSRLGEKQVLRVVLESDPDPEQAYRYLPWLDRSTVSSSASSGKPAEVVERPLLLHGKFVPLQITVPGPAVPSEFTEAGRRHVVARSWGPERIETGWWRNRRIFRDYYQIETTAGNRFWIWRRHADGVWFLHGEF